MKYGTRTEKLRITTKVIPLIASLGITAVM